MENNRFCDMIAIWHSINRKEGNLEPYLYSSFLKKYFPNRIVIANSLYRGGVTTVSIYKNSILIRKKVIIWVRYLPDILRYIAESALNTFYLFRYGKNKPVISFDPLSSLIPCMLRKMGYVRKVLFVTLDYSRKRFINSFMNRSYFLMDKFCTMAADVNICSAKTVLNYKEQKYPGIKNKQFHMPNVPPPWIVERYGNLSKTMGKIIYVGYLGKGLSLEGFKELFKAVTSLQDEIPCIRLVIVGEGEYKDELIKLAKGNGHIVFLGHLPRYEDVLKQIAESEIGIAMYNGDNSFDEFRDSAKIREYQAMGVIPITTRVARSNAEEIVKDGSGILIKDFTADCLKNSILSVMKDENLKNKLRVNSIHNHDAYKNKYSDLLDLINEL